MEPNTVDEAKKCVEHSLKYTSLFQCISENVQELPDELRKRIEHLGRLEAVARHVQSATFYEETEVGITLRQCNVHAEKLLACLNEMDVGAGRPKPWRDVCPAQKEEDILGLFTALDAEKIALDSEISAIISKYIESQWHLWQTSPDTSQKGGGVAFNRDECPMTEVVNNSAKTKATKGDSVQGTWDWVLQRREFTEWQASDKGLLCITGGPDSGKAMLGVYLPEQMRLARSPGERLLCYFLDDSLGIRDDAAYLIKNLAYQLGKRGTDYGPLLWDTVTSIVQDPDDCQVVCILDGLDECELGSPELLCSKLSGPAISELPVKLVILSRERPQLLQHFIRRDPRIRLDTDPEDDAKRGGLERYIATRLSELPQIDQYPVELRGHAQSSLYQRSQGSYLWTSLVLQGLGHVPPANVGAYLEGLPEGLGSLYDWQMRQFEPGEREFVRDVLRWCALSEKQMELSQLAEALQIQAQRALTPIEVLRGKLRHCGLLVTISKHSRKQVFIPAPRKAETIMHGDYEKVMLAHQSVKGFLTQASLSGEWFSLHDVATQHLQLAIKCLHSLHSADGSQKGYGGSCPSFWQHASKSWSYHFQRSGEHAVGLVRDYPEYFMDSPWLEKWLWSMGIRKCSMNWRLGLAGAALGLDHLVQDVVDAEKTKMSQLKIKFLRGLVIRNLGTTPLHLAAKHGHLSIIKTLMGKIPLDLEDEKRHKPVDRAVMGGRVEVAEFLLKSGAHAPDPYLLYQAIKNGDEAMVRLLLEWSPAPISTWLLRDAAHAPIWIDGVQDSMLALLLPFYARKEAEKARQWDRLSGLPAPDWMKRMILGQSRVHDWEHFRHVLYSAIRSPTSLKTIKSLLELPGTNLTSEQMQISLGVALSQRDAAVVRLFVEKLGIPLPMADAVHRVVGDTENERSLRKLRLLVEDYKGDPNLFSTDAKTQTPLAIAIRKNNIAAVRYLVHECHVDPEDICECANGKDPAKTAIGIARLLNKPEMMSLLRHERRTDELEAP
ncbi:hypothetical protein ACHAPT_006468 [Fusarium lateritium]